MTFSPEPRPGARRTTQRLLPAERPHSEPDAYDPYPTHFLLGPAYRGIEALARQLPTSGRVLIDGTPGTEWDTLAHLLDHELRALGTSAQMRDARRALLPQSVLDARFAANLGGQDPLFGRRFEGDLEAFFDPRDLDALNAPAVAP